MMQKIGSGDDMKQFLNPLVLLNAIWDCFRVAICVAILLCGYAGYWLWEKLVTILNWLKVLFFRAFAMGGNCAVTVLVAMHLCAPSMIGKKKDEKDTQEK